MLQLTEDKYINLELYSDLSFKTDHTGQRICMLTNGATSVSYVGMDAEMIELYLRSLMHGKYNKEFVLDLLNQIEQMYPFITNDGRYQELKNKITP